MYEFVYCSHNITTCSDGQTDMQKCHINVCVIMTRDMTRDKNASGQCFIVCAENQLSFVQVLPIDWLCTKTSQNFYCVHASILLHHNLFMIQTKHFVSPLVHCRLVIRSVETVNHPVDAFSVSLHRFCRLLLHRI